MRKIDGGLLRVASDEHGNSATYRTQQNLLFEASVLFDVAERLRVFVLEMKYLFVRVLEAQTYRLCAAAVSMVPVEHASSPTVPYRISIFDRNLPS